MKARICELIARGVHTPECIFAFEDRDAAIDILSQMWQDGEICKLLSQHQIRVVSENHVETTRKQRSKCYDDIAKILRNQFLGDTQEDV